VNIVLIIIYITLSTITKTTFNINASAVASFNNYNKLLFGYRCNDIEEKKKKMIVGVLLILLLMPLHINYYYYYYYLIKYISYVSYDVFLQSNGAF
jgi:hypothetical protein